MIYVIKPTINGSSLADDCAACCSEETCTGHSCRAPHGYHYEIAKVVEQITKSESL